MAVLPKLAEVRRLIDRDDHTTEEVSKIDANGIRVLTRRHIESYLFDNEVLTALCQQEGKGARLSAVIDAKEAVIADSVKRGNPVDDAKSASGELFNSLRRILEERGNDCRAFARATLAPLIKPGTAVYDELKRAIFG